MLKITRETDYALLIATRLAKAGVPRSSSQLAQECHLSLSFVSKILKILTKEAILISTRGAQGGYQLNRPPSAISLLEILVATEGPMAINACLDTDNPCIRTDDCRLAPHWAAINHVLHREFSKITLQTLIEAPEPSTKNNERYFSISQLTL